MAVGEKVSLLPTGDPVESKTPAIQGWMRETSWCSFGREDTVARVPPVVIAMPRVDVPLAVDTVPVHVHDTGALVSGTIRATTHRRLVSISGLNLMWDLEVLQCPDTN